MDGVREVNEFEEYRNAKATVTRIEAKIFRHRFWPMSDPKVVDVTAYGTMDHEQPVTVKVLLHHNGTWTIAGEE